MKNNKLQIGLFFALNAVVMISTGFTACDNDEPAYDPGYIGSGGDGDADCCADPQECGDCDDGNPCTEDVCEGATCARYPIEDSLSTHCQSAYTVDACINGELVETVAAVPDTVITLTTGRRFVVSTSREDVLEAVLQYRRRVHQPPTKANAESRARNPRSDTSPRVPELESKKGLEALAA